MPKLCNTSPHCFADVLREGAPPRLGFSNDLPGDGIFADGPNPTYLGRHLEEWLSDVLDAGALSESELPCKPVPEYELPCKAIPCFGTAILLPVMAELASLDGWKQAYLVACIAEIGIAAIPTLLRLTEHPSADVRRAACSGLPDALDAGLEIPARAAGTFAETIRVLETVPIARRDADLLRLDRRLMKASAEPEADDEVLAALVVRFDDPVAAVRSGAAEALRRLRFDLRHAGAIFSAATHLLADRNSEVSEAAAAYLRYASSRTITSSRDDVIRLRCALANRSRFVRKTVAMLLRTLPGGPHASERMLRPADREPDEPTAEQVVDALNRAHSTREPQPDNSTASLADLLRSLRSSSTMERVAALRSIKVTESDLTQVEDDILLALSDSDIAVRLAAAETLERSTMPYVAWRLHLSLDDSCLHVARAAHFALMNVVLNMSASGTTVASAD